VSPFSSALFGTLREHETPLLDPLHRKVSLVVLLENNLFGKSSVYLTEEQLQQCTFSSLGHAFSKSRESLVGSHVGLRQVHPKCDDDKLKNVLSIGRDYIRQLDLETTSFNKILQLTYQVNTLMFSSTWVSCVDFVDSFLNVTTTIEDFPSTACIVTNKTSPKYLEDPCCNQALLSTQCCFERDIPKEVEVFGDIIPRLVGRECAAGSEECVSSYLGDYLTINRNSVQCTSFGSDVSSRLTSNKVALL